MSSNEASNESIPESQAPVPVTDAAPASPVTAQAPAGEAANAPTADAADSARPRNRRGGRGGRGRRQDGPRGEGQEQQGEREATEGGRTAGQRRQAQPARPARAERQVHPVLEKLALLYPHLFGARFLPLQRGVYEELLARHPEELPDAELKVALGLHARSGRYLDAIASRLPRHSLDGAVVEPVAPEHVHHAIVELHRRRQGRTQEDLRPKLIARLVEAIEASGLDRAAYTEQVRVSKPDALAMIDEAFAELGGITARREALQRAFAASGQTDVDAFADMYGIPVGEARRFLKAQAQPPVAAAPAAPSASAAPEAPAADAGTAAPATAQPE